MNQMAHLPCYMWLSFNVVGVYNFTEVVPEKKQIILHFYFG